MVTYFRIRASEKNTTIFAFKSLSIILSSPAYSI